MSKHMIRLKARDRFLQRGITVPGYIWQEAPFAFQPLDFAIGGDRLNEKIFDAEIQEKSLADWEEDPTKPNIYGVASAPSDQRAKYFAVYLIQCFLESAPANSTVLWENLTGGFDNKAMNAEPSLIVITGLTPNATNIKLEKARELLEKHSSIPRIVVIAGEDPITFFSSRLYYQVHSIYFHSSALVKRRVEVV